MIKKRLKEAEPPPKDTSKRLIARHKTIRVLLDTGSSGDLLFLEKGSNKYITLVPCEKDCPRVMEHFQWHLQN